MNKLAFGVFTARLIRVFIIRQYRSYRRKAKAVELRLRSMLGDEIAQSIETARAHNRRWRAANPEKVNKGTVRNAEKSREDNNRWRATHRLEYNLWSMLWRRNRMNDPEYREHIRTYNREYAQWTRAVKKAAMATQSGDTEVTGDIQVTSNVSTMEEVQNDQ